MIAVVTGGAGFIGHHLVRRLLERGDEVRVIDDFSSGTRSRLAPFADRIMVTEGSVLNPRALDEAFAGTDVVFHQAAIASVQRSLIAPRDTNAVNVSGTIEVMLAADRHHVRRVVFAGSAAVYGNPRELPCRETDTPAPLSPYGISKLAAEQYLHALGAVYGIDTTSLRYFNVFGSGQDAASDYAGVITRFGAAMVQGRRPVVYGTGGASRDFVHVEDVVDANLLAADCVGRMRLTCNIGSGCSYSLLELLEALATALGRSADPVFGPVRPGDIPHSRADIELARRVLGYQVRVPFREGILRTVASWWNGP